MLKHRLFEARAEDVEIAGCKLFISGIILHLDHVLQLHSSGSQPRQIRSAKDFKLHKAVLENRLVTRGEILGFFLTHTVKMKANQSL